MVVVTLRYLIYIVENCSQMWTMWPQSQLFCGFYNIENHYVEARVLLTFI
jgi:hypothetical protein